MLDMHIITWDTLVSVHSKEGMYMGTKQISIRLPDEVLERIDKIASLADLDRSRLITNILDESTKTLMATKKIGLLQFSLLLRDLEEKMSEWAKEMREKKKFRGIDIE
jgi:metal-responsive CopG/Arc/MetJ family transcriptional regulator